MNAEQKEATIAALQTERQERINDPEAVAEIDAEIKRMKGVKVEDDTPKPGDLISTEQGITRA